MRGLEELMKYAGEIDGKVEITGDGIKVSYNAGYGCYSESTISADDLEEHGYSYVRNELRKCMKDAEWQL